MKESNRKDIFSITVIKHSKINVGVGLILAYRSKSITERRQGRNSRLGLEGKTMEDTVY